MGERLRHGEVGLNSIYIQRTNYITSQHYVRTLYNLRYHSNQITVFWLI
jgi:hypothetical protein